MLVNAVARLETLRCIRERDGRGHSEPYIWPALLAISPTGIVSVTAPAVENARVVIKNDMRAGDVANIPTFVGEVGRQVDDASPGLILAVALLESDEGPDHAMKKGFEAYVTGLRDAIQGHLDGLADPARRDETVAEIKQEVNDKVTSAFLDDLSLGEIFRIFVLGTLDPDDVIDNDFQSFGEPIASSPFTLRFGLERGGRLLFYRDVNQDGTGDVNTPGVIGQGGWQDMKFLFSGGNGIIYAVNEEGQLLFYRDTTQDGTGDVNTPSVIGQGGWQDMKFLFSGGNGIIYAVNEEGQLLFYRDTTQDGTGDVNTPGVIGQGGWQDMKFLFSGGNGIIYAVNEEGQLLFYRDTTQDGTGDVNTPSVIGQGGWQDMKFLFSGGNGIIYAVNEEGQLLFYRDTTQDGTGDVNTPGVIGQGGWQDMEFLFSAGSGIIYAVDKFVQPQNSFEIEGNLQVSPIIFERRQAQVDVATV